MPDWGGKFGHRHQDRAAATWSHDVSDYTGTAGCGFADQSGLLERHAGHRHRQLPDQRARWRVRRPGINAVLIGAMLWRTNLGDRVAIVTGSPTIDNGIVHHRSPRQDRARHHPPKFRGLGRRI